MKITETIINAEVQLFEQRGYLDFFYFDNGILCACNFCGSGIKSTFTIDDRLVREKCEGLPYGFCIYAITVPSLLLKGILLLPEGFKVTNRQENLKELLSLHNQIYPSLNPY